MQIHFIQHVTLQSIVRIVQSCKSNGVRPSICNDNELLGNNDSRHSNDVTYRAVVCCPAALSLNLSMSLASAAFAAGISSLELASRLRDLLSPRKPI